jgi:hypothetical protein
MRKVDLAGQRFGRLLVLETIWNGSNARVRCVCDCGREVTALAYNVRNGNTSSCGCRLREVRVAIGRRVGPVTGPLNATHGKSKSLTYARWQEAKKRCHSPTNQRFPEYGARGIAVCERWRNSYEAFLADMGECPPGLTLERVDGSRGYEPGNCVWATREAQAQNRPTWNKADARIVSEIRRRAAAGETGRALADEFGMSESAASKIIRRLTWRNVP